MLLLSLCCILEAGIPVSGDYVGPTEMLIKRETWGTIKKYLSKYGVSEKLHPLFDSIMKTEDWGHIGYHGANHGFRFYQDVIKFTFEELLEIPIREDFQFFRIPGDTDLNLDSVDEFFKYWGKKNVNNKDSTRAKQLLSLNYGLYSNFTSVHSCSIYLFTNDKSKKIDYEKNLAPLFTKLGISTSNLKSLSAIADKWLSKNGGVLIQVFESPNLIEDTGEAYNFADKQAYPAIVKGYRSGDQLISVHYQRAMSLKYVQKSINISDQLRLLLNTRYTLNPFSSLSVRRWDLEDKKNIKSYERELRDKIKTFKVDKEKAKKYRDSLLEIWAS